MERDSKYVSVEKAAEMLHMKPELVLFMVKDGELPISLGVGVHGYRVWKSAVEERVKTLAEARSTRVK
jgi:hypothetical protein